MHTTYDNLSDAEFVRILERDLTESDVKEAILNRLTRRSRNSEYQIGFRAGIESAGARRADFVKHD